MDIRDRARPGPLVTPARSGVEVQLLGVRHSYPSTNGDIEILREVSFVIPPAGHAALQGPSGIGKTTLLAILGGLLPVQSGSVRVGEIDVASLAGDELARYRRETVGFVFQHFGLLEALTALENVELAASLAGTGHGRRAAAEELLGAVGLWNRARHRPGQLSGGERQRVAIARSLINRPRLLLADEPTGNLDEESAIGVIELLESLQREWGFTMLVVTHNGAIAARASRRLRIVAGRVVEL